jgi:succinyldiaminopimelate transaminase
MRESRFDRLPPYPFPRLRALLATTTPGAPPIDMSLGEPRHPFPAFVTEILAKSAPGYGRYPPMEGTSELREAIAHWLVRRYHLPEGAVDPGRHVLALNGTREGLFNAALALGGETKSGARPAVLIPNPFYQCYAGAALAAGAEPIFVPAIRARNFLPDFAGLPTDLLARTAALYLCSPSNPQGMAASLDHWRTLVRLARTHDFVILADECYAEIYDKAPPPGALEAAWAEGGFANVLAFHSLSKRSSLPGLRSGFCAGDETLIARFLALRHYGGAANPLPAQAAAAACWRDETHVEQNRALYRKKFDLAERILGDKPGFYRPDGGFYLWLDVGDGEIFAKRLWGAEGVRVLPGRYLGHDAVAGEKASNPATPFVRVALVGEEAETEAALQRIARCL